MTSLWLMANWSRRVANACRTYNPLLIFIYTISKIVITLINSSNSDWILSKIKRNRTLSTFHWSFLRISWKNRPSGAAITRIGEKVVQNIDLESLFQSHWKIGELTPTPNNCQISIQLKTILKFDFKYTY